MRRANSTQGKGPEIGKTPGPPTSVVAPQEDGLSSGRTQPNKSPLGAPVPSGLECRLFRRSVVQQTFSANRSTPD